MAKLSEPCDSGITSSGRRGYVVVPNWRWEDKRLDAYDLRIAGWLASHTDSFRERHVGRNTIAEHTGISGPRVSTSLDRLAALGIITIERVASESGGKERLRVGFNWQVWEAESQGSQTTLRGSQTLLQGSGASLQGSVASLQGSVAPTEKPIEKHSENTTELQSADVETTPPRQRRRDELFDAVIEACGINYAEMTKTAKRSCAVAVAELRDVGANPLNVRTRAVHYRSHFGDAALTPSALAKHWAQCRAPAAPARKLSDKEQLLARMHANVQAGLAAENEQLGLTP